MSGPKVDSAELERRRRAQLEEERRQRAMRIQMGIAACNAVYQQIDKAIKEIQVANQANLKAAEKEVGLEQVVRDYNNAKNVAINNLQRIRNQSMPTSPEDIEALALKLGKDLEIQKREYKKQVASEEIRLKEHWENVSKQKAFEEFANVVAQAPDTDGEVVVDFEIVKEQIIEQKVVTEEFKKDAVAIIDEIMHLFNEEETSREKQKVLLNHAKTIGEAAKKDPQVAQTAIEVYELAKNKIKKDNYAFHLLYEDYLAEYVICLEILNEERQEKLPIVPKHKKQFTSLSALEEEIRLVKELAKLTDEQNYIKKQINEVMSLFGYDLCQDIVLRESPRGHHYLCNELKGSGAIHVHVSDKNQIMMEIVSTKNRAVTVDEDGTELEETATAFLQSVDELSEELVDDLLEKQGQFCHIHPQIVKELEKRGVLLTEKKHREPAKDYCKQIVNIVGRNKEDALLSDNEAQVVNRANTSNKRRKVNKLRAMEQK